MGTVRVLYTTRLGVLVEDEIPCTVRTTSSEPSLSSQTWTTFNKHVVPQLRVLTAFVANLSENKARWTVYLQTLVRDRQMDGALYPVKTV